MIGLGRLGKIGSLGAAGGGADLEPELRLSNTTVAEDATINTAIGVPSVAYGNGSYSFSIIGDPDSKFQMVVGEVWSLDTFDYETATSHSLTLRADNGVDPVIDREFIISVTDVAEGGVPVATWTSAGNDSTPGFEVDLPVGAGEGDDLVAWYRETGSGDPFVEYFAHTITAQDILDDEITLNGVEPLTEGSWDFYFTINGGTPSDTIVVVIDTTAPAIVSSTPADNSTGVAVDTDITITFDNDMQFTGSAGTIEIRVVGGAAVETYDETDVGTILTIVDDTLTIDRSGAAALDPDESYAVRISAGFLEDVAENDFPAISDDTTLNFTTAGGAEFELRIDSFFGGASGTWTAPADIIDNQANVRLWGAGGASATDGGGGGGGAFSGTPDYAVSPSTGYAYSIGNGSIGNDGGDSSFDSGGVLAKGGKSAGNGGLGALAADGVGTTKFSGGNGQVGTGTRAAGTGAGDQENGNDGSTSGVGLLGGQRQGGGASASVKGRAFSAGGRGTAVSSDAGGPGHGQIIYKIPPTAGFPRVVAREWGRVLADATSHSVALPTDIAAGDQILVFVVSDGASITIGSTDYSVLATSTDAAQVTLSVLHKTAAGTEGGTTISVTTSASEVIGWVVAVVRGGDTPTATGGTSGTSTAANSPNHAPAGGNANYLWFSAVGLDDNGQATITASPTNYKNLIYQPPGVNIIGVVLAVAERHLAAASEDPGAYTNVSEQWAAITVSVGPAP